MIGASEIAGVLGGKEILGREIRANYDLMALIEEGIPKKSLRVILGDLGQEKKIYEIVPEGTYKKRKVVFKLEESERVERLARVYATAIHVFNNKEAASAFMVSPHQLFEKRSPLNVSRTERGARELEELLWQVYFGLPV
ncbi:MAG TPA: DUF2384 domain-containing protein [Alphaproteobacteria bacterium]|nr:DUF2384 domain-containing protein [Alphaproteobacteria bacterium]HQS94777.1 DUF2384 domain-containing protein [Alphaproteobacteria bacterium]